MAVASVCVTKVTDRCPIPEGMLFVAADGDSAMKTVLALQFLAAILAFAAAAGPEVAMIIHPDQTIVACSNSSGCP